MVTPRLECQCMESEGERERITTSMSSLPKETELVNVPTTSWHLIKHTGLLPLRNAYTYTMYLDEYCYAQ